MKIFKNNLSGEELNEVASAILDGQIVVFPTETVYGIGTNALNEKSCQRIFEIKKRPLNKPLIILISNFEMLEKIVEEPDELSKKLMDKFWPGELTIILKKKNNSIIPNIVTNGDNIAIRMTNHELLRRIIEKINVPIVAPSANITGKETGTKIKEIINDLSIVDYVIDYGDIDNGISSTIVKVENNMIKLLREGKINKEELEKIAPII